MRPPGRQRIVACWFFPLFFIANVLECGCSWVVLGGASRITTQRRKRRRRLWTTQHDITPKITTSSLTVLSSSSSPLEKLLSNNGYDNRILTIKSNNLPLLAEIFVDGRVCIAKIQDIVMIDETTTAKQNKEKFSNPSTITSTEPKLVVEMPLEDDDTPSSPPTTTTAATTTRTMVVDIGQLTTIWEENSFSSNYFPNATQTQQRLRRLSSSRSVLDQSMDRLYSSRVGRGRSSSKGLSKKQIPILVQKTLSSSSSPSHRSRAENLLRKVIKTGPNHSRLVDSELARGNMFPHNSNNNNNKQKQSTILQQRALTATILALDSKTGGRFKRWPCVYISSSSNSDSISTVSLINGGWLVVDQSVRAGTEARKFAERHATDHNNHAINGISDDNDNKNKNKEKKTKRTPTTEADERIIRRLECLAMGEVLRLAATVTNNKNDRQPKQGEMSNLELDVRETLHTMNLPLSPKGAKEALIRIGRWTSPEDIQSLIEPWSSSVLEAATWFVNRSDEITNENYTTTNPRVDLTKYPCVCIDAERTTFRDDAIGIRPRSSTGRKVIPEASKWEILVHIVDVSSIYYEANNNNNNKKKQKRRHHHLDTLKEAAQKRGTSRYDLPLGPLHLLPPKVLESLSFGSSGKQKKKKQQQQQQHCVTLWAYIDERDGRLLDAGLERTIVSSPPRLLSYQYATQLLEEEATATNQDDKRLRAMLLVVERNLNLWQKRRQSSNATARKREARFRAREQQQQQGNNAATDYSNHDNDNEDHNFVDHTNHKNSFLRTRGHRFVDVALDLYGQTLSLLVKKKAKAPIPIVAGAGLSQGGRLATAPLRRYIDGEAQRQALAVLCGYGRPLTLTDCKEVGKLATEARNSMQRYRAAKRKND